MLTASIIISKYLNGYCRFLQQNKKEQLSVYIIIEDLRKRHLKKRVKSVDAVASLWLAHKRTPFHVIQLWSVNKAARNAQYGVETPTGT